MLWELAAPEEFRWPQLNSDSCPLPPSRAEARDRLRLGGGLAEAIETGTDQIVVVQESAGQSNQGDHLGL